MIIYPIEVAGAFLDVQLTPEEIETSSGEEDLMMTREFFNRLDDRKRQVFLESHDLAPKEALIDLVERSTFNE